MESFVRHHIKGNCGILEFGNTSGNSLTSNMLKEFTSSRPERGIVYPQL